MTLSSAADTTHAPKITFTRFAVEQCIRVIWGDARPSLFPVHPSQDLSVLDPIAHDIGFAPDALYNLIGVSEAFSDTQAIVESGIGPFTEKASSQDLGCTFLSGDFGGVAWCVSGYVEDHNAPIVLGEFEDKESAQALCDSLTLMLSPARVLLTVDDDGIVSEVSSKPVDIVVVSTSNCDTRDATDVMESLLTPFGAVEGANEEGVALVLYRSAEVNPAMLDHYWPQLPAGFYPPVSA